MSPSGTDMHIVLDSKDDFPLGLRRLIEARTSYDSEPDTKRRKLNTSDDLTTAEDDSWILLRRIEIHIKFHGKASTGTGNLLQDERISVPLVMRSVQPIKPYSVSEDEHSDSESGRDIESSLRWDTASFISFQWRNSENETHSFSTLPPRILGNLKTLAIVDAASAFQKASTKRLCQALFTIARASAFECVIELDLKWKNSRLFEDIPIGNIQHDFLRLLTTENDPPTISAWSPRDFYDNVYVPSKDDKTYESLDVAEIQSSLFAFQKRSVKWMLQREGVDINGQSLGTPHKTRKHHQGWTTHNSISHGQIFINHWLGLVTTHDSLMHDPYTEVSGGILAEEMGLGKTVEIIALLLRNKRDLANPDHAAKFNLTATQATLIVAPDSIIEQWASEINLHAPTLRAFLYPGVKRSGKKKENQLLAQIQESDIVLCTYNTLASEVHYARDPPDRDTRNKKAWEQERLRSPLVQLHWWRCVLDECQMIQSGVSSAAEVALQIPRQHAWAVSGTPLRKDPGDVYGLLRFLRLLPYSWSPKTWTRLLDHYQGIFKDLVKRIVLRHTKHLVKDELELPPQKRIISTVSLTQIEEQHYSNTFDRMCQKMGLSREGAPLNDDWDPNEPAVVEQMRSWLTRLRQLCLHPDVGTRNMRALGGRAQDVLRTVEDVLKVMMEQNDALLRTDERAFLLARLRRGQILEAEHRIQEALNVWKEVLPQIQDFVHRSRLDVERLAAESVEEDQSWISADRSQKAKMNQPRTRLRLALELEHMAQFFIGNAYFQIKDNKDITTPESTEFQRLEKLEVCQYDAAKAIRLEMLAESSEEVQKLISEIAYEPSEDERRKTMSHEPHTSTVIRMAKEGLPRVEERGGIESGRVLDELDRYAEYFNPLMNQVMEWRNKLIELLSKPLVDYGADEIQGDEYEVSMKEQDEVYTRMDIFRASVEDLEELLSGQENTLIRNEANTWTKLAKDGKGHAAGLMLELLEIRNSLKPPQQLGSIRGTLTKLRLAANNMGQGEPRDSRKKIEAHLMRSTDFKFKSVLQNLDRVKRYLQGDVRKFIELQNSRLDFYRQLQHISDLVVPWLEENPEDQAVVDETLQAQRDEKLRKTIRQARAKLDAEEAQLEASIKKKTSQARYLEHLKNASSLGEERKCIICQDEQYEIGVLTECGHLFCKDCINVWLASHARCPQCRTAIKSRSELYQITYKPQGLRMEEEEVTNESSDAMETNLEDSPKFTSIYSQITTQQLNEIKSIELPRAFGTKIDFIARHILWLRRSDANKTVVFSQFREFCPGTLARAFDQIGIKYAVIGGKIGVDRFKYDAGIECLLMHAGSQASGMNLVNASNVLLCEPLVNTALELQAIARVHRIGQHRPTTVWMYLIEGSVEKAIYDLSVERRLDHLGRQKKQRRSGISTPIRIDEDIEAVDAEEMTDKPLVTLLSKDNRSGEIVGKDDLWQCLFGNVQPRRGLPELEAENGAIVVVNGSDEDVEMLEN